MEKGLNVRVWNLSVVQLVEEVQRNPGTAEMLRHLCHVSLQVTVHLFSKDLHEAWKKYSAAQVSSRPRHRLHHLVEDCLFVQDHRLSQGVAPFLSLLATTELAGNISSATVNSLIKTRSKIHVQLTEAAPLETTESSQTQTIFLRTTPLKNSFPKSPQLDMDEIVVTTDVLLTTLVRCDPKRVDVDVKKTCSTFFSYFFDIRILGSQSEFQEDKYALLHFVSQHFMTHEVRDHNSLKAALQERFWCGKKPVSDDLEKVALEVAQRVLMEEWSCASTDKGSQKKLIKLRHGSYRLDAFHRAVQAAFLLRYDMDNMNEQLQAEIPLCQDILLLKTFSERCISRISHDDAWIEMTQDDDLVQEVLDVFDDCPLLSTKAPLESNLEIMGALRVFFRVAVQKVDADEATKAKLVDHLEGLIFTSTFSRKHFVSRNPMMLLGNVWPKVYDIFHKRVVLQTDRDDLTRLVSQLDQAALFRVLLYKPCGAPFDDFEDVHRVLVHFVKKLDGLGYHDYIMCTRDSYKSLLSDHAEKYYFFLGQSEKECWNDHLAQDVLQQIFRKGIRSIFAFPDGSFRLGELSRHVGDGGVALVCVPSSTPRQLAFDCTRQFPLPLRIFARCHSDYFSLLPMCYRTVFKDLNDVVKGLHNLGVSCWCAAKFQEVQVSQQRHQLFPSRNITIDQNAQLDSLFGSPNEEMRDLLGEVEELQHRRVMKLISQMEVPGQSVEWITRLTGILKRANLDTDVEEEVKAVLFEEENYPPLLKNGILTLPKQDMQEMDRALHCELLAFLHQSNVAIFQQRLCGRVRLLYKLRESGFSPCYRYGIVLRSDWTHGDIVKLGNHIKDADKDLCFDFR
jgi:hypothetical protein